MRGVPRPMFGTTLSKFWRRTNAQNTCETHGPLVFELDSAKVGGRWALKMAPSRRAGSAPPCVSYFFWQHSVLDKREKHVRNARAPGFGTGFRKSGLPMGAENGAKPPCGKCPALCFVLLLGKSRLAMCSADGDVKTTVIHCGSDFIANQLATKTRTPGSRT